MDRGKWDDHTDMHSVGLNQVNFRFALILLQNMHEFSPFSYNSSLWECMAQCISYNFMPDLDKDLEVGSFNFVFSGQYSIYYSLFLPPKNIFINH